MNNPTKSTCLATFGLFALLGAAQSGLETIAMLGLVGDHLPKDFPPLTPEKQAALTKKP